jgi:hypothetical protein
MCMLSLTAAPFYLRSIVFVFFTYVYFSQGYLQLKLYYQNSVCISYFRMFPPAHLFRVTSLCMVNSRNFGRSRSVVHVDGVRMCRWTLATKGPTVQSHGGMILTGKTRRSRSKTCPIATLSPKNPTRTDPGEKLRICGERLAANLLSHGTASSFDLQHCLQLCLLLLVWQVNSLLIYYS